MASPLSGVPENLRRLLTLLLDEREIEDLVSDPTVMLAEPHTVLRRLTRAIEERLGRQGPQQLAALYAELLRLALAATEAPPAIEDAPPAKASLTMLLERAAGIVDPDAFDQELRPIWSINPALITPSGSSDLANPAAGPEAAAAVRLRVVQQIAETWYKPMLTVTLRLALLSEGMKPKVPPTLGAVFHKCRKIVNGPEEILLDDLIVFVRNSVAHPTWLEFYETHVELTGPEGPVLCLAPTHVSDLVGGIVELCSNMLSAFHRFSPAQRQPQANP